MVWSCYVFGGERSGRHGCEFWRRPILGALRTSEILEQNPLVQLEQVPVRPIAEGVFPTVCAVVPWGT
jgi:hypothetical protein